MTKNESLADCIVNSMEQYFDDLNGQAPQNLQHFFINEVEEPFLQVVMKRVKGNQSRAAEILGINRNTLRKKLKLHNLN